MFNRKKEQKDIQVGKVSQLVIPERRSQEGEKQMTTFSDDAGKPAGMPKEVNAYFGKGSKFSGTLCFEATVRVDGKVDGEIQSNDTLIIGESADVRANIKVRNMF